MNITLTKQSPNYDLKQNQTIDKDCLGASVQNFHYIKTHKSKNHQFLTIKKHQPILIGNVVKKKKSIFKKVVVEAVIATQYPMMLTGSPGAGTGNTLLAFSNQYIQHREGLIYLYTRADPSIYQQIFSLAKNANRTEDLYLLNFKARGVTISADKNEYSKASNSIDPINPMVDDKNYFQIFFGDFGLVIHEVLQHLHSKNEVLSIEGLEKLLTLNNLIGWFKTQYFGECSALKSYFDKIGLNITKAPDEVEMNNALSQHMRLSHQAHQTIHIFKQYPEIFTHECSVSIKNIFLERKILTILLDETNIENERDVKSVKENHLIAELMLYQIAYFDNRYQSYHIHFQNIILSDFNHYIDKIEAYFPKMVRNSANNYIYHSYDYCDDKRKFFTEILSMIKTFIVMKMENVYLPKQTPFNLLNSTSNAFATLDNTRTSFHLKTPLNCIKEGQAVILMNNTKPSLYSSKIDFLFYKQKIFNRPDTYQIEYILCQHIYLDKKTNDKAYIIAHPTFINR